MKVLEGEEKRVTTFLVELAFTLEMVEELA